MNRPTPLGLKKSFGFGDRLGLATPGHIAAIRKTAFAPIFAQQSVREMERTRRAPEEVLKAAQDAVDRLGYSEPWGADADHHKTAEDVRKSAAAGFTFFTIDPSAYVANEADRMDEGALKEGVTQLVQDGVFQDEFWHQSYLGRSFPVRDGLELRFKAEELWRAAIKYGRAIGHSECLAREIASACAGRGYEIEVSVDETESVTSPLDHLFCGLELKRRGVPVVSLAPRFIGDFEKGIDYRGDAEAFEAQLRDHLAVARFCGPHKISIHSGSDKFSIYPIIGRVCGELLHVKTAGTNYLEALRVVARTAPGLFGEMARFCRSRFETDRRSYHLSTTQAEIGSLAPFTSARDERLYLDERVGRQLLHVTFGSVLTVGTDTRGRPFKEGILEQLHRHADLHLEFLEKHLGRHLTLLEKG